ncbi:MAG: DNA ligase [Phycisphaerales bacterium]|nr:DNA ligase [Phycisphaerales bacterium]
MKAALAPYRRKRDFAATREPTGDDRDIPTTALARFVVQKHDASRLHYDFRLEAAGVLKSWAVPKGPSLNPADKRLAVRTEDHPLEYADFEGTIPRGQYGGGTVMVWDQGTYHNLSSHKGKVVPLERAVDTGYAKVWLQGTKLRGAWVLTRSRRMTDAAGEDAGSGKEQWLLFKVDDAAAEPDRDVTSDSPLSAVTGRGIDQIANGRSRVWNSNRE